MGLSSWSLDHIAFSWRVFPKVFRIKGPWGSWNYQFNYKPLGTAQVKGVSEPVELYEVVGVGPLRTRLEVVARRGLVRFVGRQGELAQLQHALEQARGGRGQIVGVVGEPGGGKSRLCYECKLRAQRGCLVL